MLRPPTWRPGARRCRCRVTPAGSVPVRRPRRRASSLRRDVACFKSLGVRGEKGVLQKPSGSLWRGDRPRPGPDVHRQAVGVRRAPAPMSAMPKSGNKQVAGKADPFEPVERRIKARAHANADAPRLYRGEAAGPGRCRPPSPTLLSDPNARVRYGCFLGRRSK